MLQKNLNAESAEDVEKQGICVLGALCVSTVEGSGLPFLETLRAHPVGRISV
jgi:hypothetical protein